MPVIDADALAHELYRPGAATTRAVAAAFGESVLGPDGGVDRRALGRRVWNDPAERHALNQLMWPRILKLAARRAVSAAWRRHSGGLVVLEAAVLLEAGWDEVCDEVWTVSVTEAEQRARLAARDGVTDDAEIQGRLSAQMGAAARAPRAHVVLSTEAEAGTEAAARSSGPRPLLKGPTLEEQVETAVDGAHARAARALPTAARGTAAALWSELCAQLGVPPPAARRWWRELYARYAAPHRHCHGMDWLRCAARGAAARRGAAQRPAALMLAAFFARAEVGASAGGEEAAAHRSAALLARFAQCAPRLAEEDRELATGWVARGSAACDAAAGGAEAPGSTALRHDTALVLRATRGWLASPPPEYARHVARLQLERRCVAAEEGAASGGESGGLGLGHEEAAERAAELRRWLAEPRGALCGEQHEEAARANLRAELKGLVAQLGEAA